MNNFTTALLIFIASLGGLVLLSSCNSCRQDMKAIKSRTSGLQRTVTLFDANGKPIRVWNINSTYQTAGTGINFLDKDEKFVAINGTFIVEEK
jgi:hypothetical protein